MVARTESRFGNIWLGPTENGKSGSVRVVFFKFQDGFFWSHIFFFLFFMFSFLQNPGMFVPPVGGFGMAEPDRTMDDTMDGRLVCAEDASSVVPGLPEEYFGQLDQRYETMSFKLIMEFVPEWQLMLIVAACAGAEQRPTGGNMARDFNEGLFNVLRHFVMGEDFTMYEMLCCRAVAFPCRGYSVGSDITRCIEYVRNLSLHLTKDLANDIQTDDVKWFHNVPSKWDVDWFANKTYAEDVYSVRGMIRKPLSKRLRHNFVITELHVRTVNKRVYDTGMLKKFPCFPGMQGSQCAYHRHMDHLTGMRNSGISDRFPTTAHSFLEYDSRFGIEVPTLMSFDGGDVKALYAATCLSRSILSDLTRGWKMHRDVIHRYCVYKNVPCLAFYENLKMYTVPREAFLYSNISSWIGTRRPGSGMNYQGSLPLNDEDCAKLAYFK